MIGILRIIFGNIIKWSLNKFKKKYEKVEHPIDDESLDLYEAKLHAIEHIDYDSLPDPIIINPDGNTTLIIVDDLPEAFILYDSDFEQYKQEMGKDCLNDIKIVKCHGKDAANMAFKYLHFNKIDKALLDISLIKQPIMVAGERLILEGFDVAVELHKSNPEMEIAVCTSNAIGMGTNGSVAGVYRDIFERHTKRNFMKAYINRSALRTTSVKELIYTDAYSYEKTKLNA